MSLTKFTSITGTCVPVPGPDMDTDRIIPSRFLKCITFDELAGVMFWDERFDENGQSKSHPVDDPRFKGASIILGGSNFGCGSSREHAPIAIRACGVSCVIAPSFARIFYRNAINIGFPILECPKAAAEIANGDQVSVDFATGTITDETTGKTYHATAFPPFIQKIIAHGGLLSYLKARQQNMEAE